MSRSMRQDNREAQAREHERQAKDPDTVSVYEVGSVAFLQSLARLPHWEEAGVPVSGDKTATFVVRNDLGPIREHTHAEPTKSCPTRLMDGRNEIRCWLTAGHEGDCK